MLTVTVAPRKSSKVMPSPGVMLTTIFERAWVKVSLTAEEVVLRFSALAMSRSLAM